MDAIDFQKELNKTQYEAVTAGDGPHLVLAGAGSGKTRTLVYRVAWLVSQGVPADKILLLTFTNKAANEMMTRAKKLLGMSDTAKFALWGGTFHSIANRLLRIYGRHIGLANNFTIIDSADVDSLLKSIAKGYLSALSDKHKPSPALIRETISYSNNAEVSIEESLERKFPEWSVLLAQFEAIAKEYQKRKKTSNVLDFDDLLLYWLKLTKDAKVGPMLAKKWDYILVDEYQDTNTIQAEVIFNLSKQHQNILVVGDDAQSIYSFRAADIRNILEFPQQFKQSKMHKLETNYRSIPEVLDLANAIISGNGQQFSKNLQAVKASADKPLLAALRSNHEEAYFVADKINQLLDSGLEPEQVAVLFRAAHHSQNLEMELNKRGIAYEMRGGLKFFERAHVKDVLAFIKLLGNFKDETAWLRVLQMYEGIGPVTAHQIYGRIVEHKTIEDLLDSKFELTNKAAKSWSRIYMLLAKMYRAKQKNIGKLISIVSTDYNEYLMEKYSDYRQRQDDLDQLAIFAVNYDDLSQFLSEISLQENYNVEQEAKQAVHKIVLSTVHQAKGLEWEAVFVINMTDKSFPHPLCVSEDEQAEERRLFYVAVTRAQRYLYLTYPLSMFKYDGYQSLKVSPFVSSLDSGLLEHNDLSRSVTYASSDDVEYIADPDVSDSPDDDFLPDVSDW